MIQWHAPENNWRLPGMVHYVNNIMEDMCMRVSGRSPWQRIVSLALCLAMLLSFLPATARAVEGTASEGLSIPAGMTLDASAPAGYTAYTAPARADVYGGWKVTDLSEDSNDINGGSSTVVADEEFLGLVSDEAESYSDKVTTASYSVQLYRRRNGNA